MLKKLKTILSLVFLIPVMAIGQKEKEFSIDSARILSNQNWDDFERNLKVDTFQTFSTKDAIPKNVRNELKKLAKGFSIANPNENYRCCCTSPDNLPDRQLTFIAKSKDVLVMTYNTGGFGVSSHLLMIRFDKDGIVDLWSGYCWAEIKKVDDIVWFINESKKPDKPGRRRPSIQVGLVII